MPEKRLRPLLKRRFDEVVPLAHLLWASYQRDKADFMDLLPRIRHLNPGMPLRAFLFADHGLEIYGSGLVTSDALIRERQSAGEVSTGLLYISPDSEDMIEQSAVVDGPLYNQPHETLCPGSAQLEKLQLRFR